jgi:type VI protein secretion system component Hcp
MVTLVNARVLSIAPSAQHSKGINTRDPYELLEIEFTFQKIDVTCVDSKSIWKDDWKA